MKNFIAFSMSLMLLISAFNSQSQDTATLIPPHSYKAVLQTKEGKTINGDLQQINSSAILINMNTYNFENINTVKIYRKGSVGRGLLIGFLSGAVIGIATGLISGDDNPNQWFAMTAGEKAFGGAVLFGAAGAATGAIVGLIHKQFTINGKSEKYQLLRKSMAGKFQPRLDF